MILSLSIGLCAAVAAGFSLSAVSLFTGCALVVPSVYQWLADVMIRLRSLWDANDWLTLVWAAIGGLAFGVMVVILLAEAI
jgi:hypothetical protein